MRAKVKVFFALWISCFLIALNLTVSYMLTQKYGGVHLIPQEDLIAYSFWLLLNIFGIVLLMLLKLLFPDERMMIIETTKQPNKRKTPKKKPRKPKTAQKQPGKKHKQSPLAKKESKIPNDADETQAPGKPAASEAPEIWKKEEFE